MHMVIQNGMLECECVICMRVSVLSVCVLRAVCVGVLHLHVCSICGNAKRGHAFSVCTSCSSLAT